MALTLLTAASVRAQINVLSDSSNLNISGWAQTSPQSAVNYSSSSTGGSLNGSVFESGPGGAALASSSLQLNTTVSTSQIGFTSDAYVNTGGGSGGGQSSYAEANYSFSLSFNVSDQVAYNLSFPTLQGSGRQHTLDQQFSLSSANDGVIVSQPTLGPGFSGMLTPGDTYTLSISEEITSDTPDFFGNEWRQDLDFNLTTVNLNGGISAVPEPSSGLLLGATAVGMGLVAFSRKRFGVKKS